MVTVRVRNIRSKEQGVYIGRLRTTKKSVVVVSP